MSRPFSEYRNTPLWRALELMVSELQATREVTVSTGTEYVVGFIYRELVAKKLVNAEAVALVPGR